MIKSYGEEPPRRSGGKSKIAQKKKKKGKKITAQCALWHDDDSRCCAASSSLSPDCLRIFTDHADEIDLACIGHIKQRTLSVKIFFALLRRGMSSSSVRYFERDFDPESVVAAGSARLAEQGAAACGVIPAAPPLRAWTRFHWRNAGRFFHERRYLPQAFPALACADTQQLAALLASGADASARDEKRLETDVPPRPLVILETGAGNGSNVAALRAANPAARLLVTDFCAASLRFCAEALAATAAAAPPAAVAMAPLLSPPELYLFDVTAGDGESKGGVAAARSDDAAAAAAEDWAALPAAMHGGVDVTLCTFVLSAVPPAAHVAALRGVASTLRPGGLLCLRDYALFDAAQLRARSTSVVSRQLHVRGDGTLAYYFSEAEVRRLLEEVGLAVRELRTCAVVQRNRAQGTEMRRLFIHAVAVKE